MLKPTKQCTKCRKIKNTSCFSTDNSRKDKLQLHCKKCSSVANKKRYRSKDGLISRIYNSQISSSKKRGHTLPTYTKNELKEWILSQDIFHILFKAWEDNGYKKEFVPSCDRHNENGDYDYKPYSLDILRITTWEENTAKSKLDRRNGTNNKVSTPVNQYTIDGEIIGKYHSMNEAYRQTGVNTGDIHRGCNISQPINGVIWEYAN